MYQMPWQSVCAILTRVDFMIEYQFKSFFLDKVMGSLFKKATIKMLDAFELRAENLHN